MKKDLIIQFCPKCNWKIVNPNSNELTNRCPKCDGWTFEISQFYHYKDGKIIDKEFTLTDNDEIHFSSYDYKLAHKIIDKGFRLFEKELKSSQKNSNKKLGEKR